MPASEAERLAVKRRRETVYQLRMQTHLTVDRIAARVGVAVRTVERDLTVLGLTDPRPAPMSPERKQWAKSLLDQGGVYTDVARRVRCSPTTLRRLFPGYALTRAQVGALAAGNRWPNRDA